LGWWVRLGISQNYTSVKAFCKRRGRTSATVCFGQRLSTVRAGLSTEALAFSTDNTDGALACVKISLGGEFTAIYEILQLKLCGKLCRLAL
jgi:hypothetical protein